MAKQLSKSVFTCDNRLRCPNNTNVNDDSEDDDEAAWMESRQKTVMVVLVVMMMVKMMMMIWPRCCENQRDADVGHDISQGDMFWGNRVLGFGCSLSQPPLK